MEHMKNAIIVLNAKESLKVKKCGFLISLIIFWNQIGLTYSYNNCQKKVRKLSEYVV